jgi:hypothetical protein
LTSTTRSFFGRSNACHARLSEKDTTASRHHFILEVNPPDACIRDLGSRNGNYVNSVKYGGRSRGETPEDGARRKFPEVNLHDGDEIRVGDTVFFRFPWRPPRRVAIARQPIEDRDRKACELSAGTYICPACRERSAKNKRAGQKTRARALHAMQQGRFVRSGTGSPWCLCLPDVPRKSDADPAALLRKLLLEGPKERAEPGSASIPGYEIGKMLGKGRHGRGLSGETQEGWRQCRAEGHALQDRRR